MMSERQYKTMGAKEIVKRLRDGDYVDEHRTADVIVALVLVLDSATSLGEVALRAMEEHGDDEARRALERFTAAAKFLRDKGIS